MFYGYCVLSMDGVPDAVYNKTRGIVHKITDKMEERTAFVPLYEFLGISKRASQSSLQQAVASKHVKLKHVCAQTSDEQIHTRLHSSTPCFPESSGLSCSPSSSYQTLPLKQDDLLAWLFTGQTYKTLQKQCFSNHGLIFRTLEAPITLHVLEKGMRIHSQQSKEDDSMCCCCECSVL